MRKIIDLGVRKENAVWQNSLIQQVNLTTLIAGLTVALSIIVLWLTGIYYIIPPILTFFVAVGLVFLFNHKGRFYFAAYSFFVSSIFLISYFSVTLTLDSNIFIFYFPDLIILVLIFGRKELFKHMLVVFVMFAISFSFFILDDHFNWIDKSVEQRTVEILKYSNVVLGFLCVMSLLFGVAWLNDKKDYKVKKVLEEKDLLLAEVYHRVKNNLNLINSMLNLKKNSSESELVQNALEDCRSRVFSMSLVHNKLYSHDSVDQLELSQYLKDLTHEVINSFGEERNIEFSIRSEKVSIGLTEAIPMGLILNEIVTNAVKHARNESGKLRIDIDLFTERNKICLKIKDNGKGFDIEDGTLSNSVGFEIIGALVNQLEGEYEFGSDDGVVFNISIPYY